jgi:hypothetical protein
MSDKQPSKQDGKVLSFWWCGRAAAPRCPLFVCGGSICATVQQRVCSGGSLCQVAPTWIPPQEGNAAPVADAPAGPLFDGSQTGMRGADPAGYEHGANYGSYLATGFNMSLVDDGEAASRAEYRYQQHHVQRQASRTPAYGDPYGCPRPNARSLLRTSFDGREGESQSLQVLGRIKDVMSRMERHFGAVLPE